MGRQSSIRYVVAGLVLFLFTSGFLGFCVGPNYKPCLIELTDPANGTVLDPGTVSITISGKIVKGDSNPLWLFAFNEKGASLGQIPFDKTTGGFTYTAALNAKQYTTVTFEIKDTNLIGNKERISFAVGNSSTPGAPHVVDNAARLLLNEDFMNQVEVIGAEFINTWKNDLIYGTRNPDSPFAGMNPVLPLKVSAGSGMGTIEINPAFSGIYKGYVNLGAISMAIDIKPGGVINANLSIAPEAWVNPNGTGAKAIYVQGRHWAWLMGDPHFTLKADSVDITNAKLRMSVNAENKITASLDLSDANLSFANLQGEYGILDFPDWLMNWIIGLVKDQILSMLALNIPIVDANNIVLPPLMGIQAGGWPMNTSTIFTSTEQDMTIDLGVSAKLASGVIPLEPGLTKFYATPGDPLPALAITGDENMQIALTDDIVNNLAFVAVQASLVKDLDVTQQFKDELGQLSPKDLICKVTLDTPPILDFSGDPISDLLSIFDFGRVVVRNLKLEISTKALLGYPIALRMSADANCALKLDVSDDGKEIVGGIDVANSDINITICYDSFGNATLAKKIGKDIANPLVDGVLKKMLRIKVPDLPLYGSNVNIALMGSELNSNALIAKVRITH
jgi:hypothetical protein